MPAGDKLLPIKVAERDAAKKLLQAKLHGLESVSVFESLCKLKYHELDLPDEGSANTVHFIKHRMHTALGDLPWTRELEFEIIMYKHELYQGFSHYYSEYGALIWADKALERFLLVNVYEETPCGDGCGRLLKQDYKRLLKLSAQRLLNLVSYLPLSSGGPRWVRATFCSFDSQAPPYEFYSFYEERSYPTPPGVKPLKHPPILHLTPGNTPPVLHERDITPLNCLILRAGLSLPSAAVRGKVVKSGEPVELPTYATKSHKALVEVEVNRNCEGCGKKLSMDDMRRCSGCRRVFYCGMECAKKGWKRHKAECMPKEG